jgi:putative effector of murein hydrolase LrgA (UPF0299 family)
MEQKKTNILAIVALCFGILGLVSLFLFAYIGNIQNTTRYDCPAGIIALSLGILAIVLGIIELVKIRKGMDRGRWMIMAIVGIVSGVASGWGGFVTLLTYISIYVF